MSLRSQILFAILNCIYMPHSDLLNWSSGTSHHMTLLYLGYASRVSKCGNYSVVFDKMIGAWANCGLWMWTVYLIICLDQYVNVLSLWHISTFLPKIDLWVIQYGPCPLGYYDEMFLDTDKDKPREQLFGELWMRYSKIFEEWCKILEWVAKALKLVKM